MEQTIKELCALNATSGREEAVREYLIKEIEPYTETFTDVSGNLHVYKKGKNPAKKKVMLASHMDEVALIITYITDDGFLKFAPVGGIDSRVVFGGRVLVGEKLVSGVVGSKPIHLLKKDESDKVPDFDSLYIDIGAQSKEDAEKYVNLGDIAYFDSESVDFGNGFLKAKALDDRVGCAILLDMIKREQPYDLHFVFTVQEEVGLRGAKTAAFIENPDYAIVVETTTACDIAGVDGADRVCQLGNGAVVSFMDRSTLYDKKLFNFAFKLSEENGINCQTKTVVAGGNDAGAIHVSRGGVKTITVSLPCRYLHSPSCVICKKDLKDSADLVQLLAERFADDSVD